MTKQEAIEAGERYYETGVPCKNGHLSKRSVANSTCYQCQQDRSSQFRVQNIDYHKEYNKQYVINNADELRVRYKVDAQRRRDTKKAQVSEVHKQYRLRHQAKWRARTRRNMSLYPELYYALNAARRARKLNATPQWADTNKIQEIYSDCHLINTICKMYGAADTFVVDHVVPLQGKNVCGLHVENNLEIVLATYNAQKHNKHEIAE